MAKLKRKKLSLTKLSIVLLLGLVMVLIAVKPAEAAISRIWAVDDGEKILRKMTLIILSLIVLATLSGTEMLFTFLVPRTRLLPFS